MDASAAVAGLTAAALGAACLLPRRHSATGRRVRFGPDSEVTFGEGCELGVLRSSAEAYAAGDHATLRRNFAEDGYCYIPQALDRAAVLDAQAEVLRDLAARGSVLDASRPIKEAVLREGCAAGCVPFLEGRNGSTHSDAMVAVLEGERIRAAVAAVLGVPSAEDVRTFDYKWLRAVPKEQFSGAHVDWVYMGGGSRELLTCWIPIGDIPVHMGTLAVCAGSHRLPSFAKLGETYGKLDWEADHLDGSGWFTDDPAEVTQLFGGRWASADFKAGDLLVFGMKTLHMSTTNMTDKLRLSCDVRWQPKTDPIDERYLTNAEGGFGKLQKAGIKGVNKAEGEGRELEATGDAPSVTIRELRENWGFPLTQAHEKRGFK
jgi:ectoine hydroxylase-related dioxygenase (phytanoyl-CoA dioxygenase family)